jgi:hypothetical protein
MANVSMEEVFEDLWEQMEELSRSCDKADGKLARGIARHLVDYFDLPRSYRIRAHMALTSLLCAQDAEKDYAEVQCKIPAGLHSQLQEELHAELKAIREAYDHDATEEFTSTLQDESTEDTIASTPTETPQLGPGSQEDPIDLTLDDDSSPSSNTRHESVDDSGYAEATDTPSTRFSLPRSTVTCTAHTKTDTWLTTPPARFFVHPFTVRLVAILISLSLTTLTSATIVGTRTQ